jgi:hypothetical protein
MQVSSFVSIQRALNETHVRTSIELDVNASSRTGPIPCEGAGADVYLSRLHPDVDAASHIRFVLDEQTIDNLRRGSRFQRPPASDLNRSTGRVPKLMSSPVPPNDGVVERQVAVQEVDRSRTVRVLESAAKNGPAAREDDAARILECAVDEGGSARIEGRAPSSRELGKPV